MAEDNDLLVLTADVVASFVGANTVAPGELPELIRSVHTALANAGHPQPAAEAEVPKATSAQVRKSVTPEALTSFIDGKPYKSLKRHLTTNGMSPDEYRTRYGLPRDYPMVAASYSAQRSALAKQLGLGARRAQATAQPEPAKRGRKPKSQAQPEQTQQARQTPAGAAPGANAPAGAIAPDQETFT